MIEQYAQIEKIDNGFAWVEVMRQSACGHCHANKGCGTASLDRLLRRKSSRLRIPCRSFEAQPGDWVVLGIAETSMVRTALMVYLLPLMGLLVGAIFGRYVDFFGHGNQFSSLAAPFFALIGFSAAWFGTSRFIKGVGDDPRYQPQLVRFLHRADAPSAIPLMLTQR